MEKNTKIAAQKSGRLSFYVVNAIADGCTVKDHLFTFLSNPSVPYDNNYIEWGVRKIKIKQKVGGCFRTDSGADDFTKLHSIAETAMKNGNSKFNAILAVVQ